MMKKTLQLFVALLVTTTLLAQDFDDGTFNYTITDTGTLKCEVHSIISPQANVTIPTTALNSSTATTYDVTAIGANAFDGDATITSLILPSSVVTIKEKAYNNCANLTSANLENVVTFDGNSQFAATGLTEVDLSSAVTFPGYQFYWCASLTKVNNLNVVETFGNGVFRRSGITTINFPSSLNEVGDQLFRQCTALTAIQANWSNPASDVVINNSNVFGNITPADITLYVPVGAKSIYEVTAPWNEIPAANIVEGTIPETSVGDAFTLDGINYTVTSDNPNQARVSGVDTPMAVVIIPLTATNPNNSEVYDITAIGSSAFLDDVTVASVELPTSVTVLNGDAFSGCINLETINLENIVTIETQNAFFNCPKLTTANLAAATSVGNFAFHSFGNSTLSSIHIPNLVSIGGSAFRTSDIPSIEIPATVTEIGSRAFMDCMSLKGIQVNWAAAGDIPIIDASVFENLTISDMTLYVPTGTSAFYATSAVWEDFIIEEGTLSTNNLEQEISFSIYPNPTNGIVSIKSKQLNNVNVGVYDLNGRILINKNISGTSSELNMSNLASGIYLLKVQVKNAAFTKRVVKQ